MTLHAEPDEVRATVVCRAKGCRGGGWWGDAAPERCPSCGGRLIEVAPTYVIDLPGVDGR